MEASSAKKKDTIEKLKEDKIGRLILKYAVPSIIGTIVIAIYTISNTIYIAYAPGLGDPAVGAMTVCIPLTLMGSALCSLMGGGAATRISLALGNNNKQMAYNLLGNVFTLSFILFTYTNIFTLVFIDPTLSLIGSTQDHLFYAKDFLIYYLPPAVFLMLSLSLNNVIRASGHPKKAMVIMMIILVSNIVLVPFSLFVLQWGMKGVAIANNIAGIIAFIPTMYHFLKKNSDFPLSFKYMKLQWKVVKSILDIGISPFLIQFTAAFVMMIINNRLKAYGGAPAVTAYGFAYPVTVLFIWTLSGLSQGIQPIIGYNYGAERIDRVLKTFKITVFVGVVIGTSGLLVSLFFSSFLVGIFSESSENIPLAIVCLKIITLGLPLSGFQMVTGSFFQSIGAAKKAFYLSITRQLIFLIPAAFIFPLFWGVRGVWYSIPVSDLLSTLLAIGILFVLIRSFKTISNK
ncbi:MAG: MATE family efflux transporter [Dysgonamonadaceae bacterium]|nr:MATE family efflux transporter [Dysgonamonadaceae bacterium]